MSTTSEPISFDTITEMESGHYRVAFENRTQWNCDLIVADDGLAIFWVDNKNGPTRDREFPLAADPDGFALATNKPGWGRMTRLVAR